MLQGMHAYYLLSTTPHQTMPGLPPKIPHLIAVLHHQLERPASNVLPAAATPLHVALLLLLTPSCLTRLC